MAVGNTFGATTFTSFGAYWVTFAMISTFENPDTVKDAANTTCQNETLTGLFMLVWIAFVQASDVEITANNYSRRPGSYSQL
jgi:succinate-acetate transporter protein